MRFYYDEKRNHIYIVSKKEELPSVTFCADYGKRSRWERDKPRYNTHWSSINEGYSTNLTEDEMNNHFKDCERLQFYKVKRVKRRVKIGR